MKELYFDLPAGRLSALTVGNDDAPIILALHGWLDNAASFTPIANYWADYFPNHRLIAVDLPGHGHSFHRGEDAYYHFVDWLDVILELFELNKWQKIDVIGHSMGGMIASAFAAAFPERVNHLALIESIGFVTDEVDETASHLRKSLLRRWQFKQKQQSADEAKAHQDIESAIRARLAVSDLNYESAKLIVERGTEALEAGVGWRSDPRLRLLTPLRINLAQGIALCKALESKVHVIKGDKGFDMVANGLTSFSEHIQYLTFSQVNGGHHVHMESPRQVLSEISLFFAN